MKNILVTGGAGFIGSAVTKELIKKNFEVIVVDNLSKGLLRLVDKKAKFYKLDITDNISLEKVFKENKIDVIIHFAAYKAAGESMTDVVKYSNNIKGTINLLDYMVKYKVNKIIYSSTAAVYGYPEYLPVDENHPTKPINYYGFSKLVCENLIDWYSKIYGINYVSLRYFNVAGDAGFNYIDPEANNIFPVVMEVISGKREKFFIFGEDYNTRDRTCIRDYIDINDLVDAHISSLNLKTNEIINLGTSNGITVKELIDAVKQITGKEFQVEIGKRREGDPANLIASNQKAFRILNWEPKRDIKETIKSTYEAYKNLIK